MRVTVVPMVVGALGTVPNGLERRLEELEIREIIQTTAQLRSARIIRNKSSRGLRRLAVAQTSVNYLQLTNV